MLTSFTSRGSFLRTSALVGLSSCLLFLGATYFTSQRSAANELIILRQRSAGVHLTNKSALVVGGTNGIGRGIALRLAQAGCSVTIVGRNKESGNEVVQQMQKLSSSAKFDFIPCDVQELGKVQQVSQAYSSQHGSLDYLVLTQGIGTIQGRTETSEGLDQKLSLHYYSRMAFIDNLLPVLQTGSTPKVLSVLSGGVHSPYKDYQTDPELKINFSLKNAADSAGFYNDLMLDAYSRRNPEITFIHNAPGFVDTNWGSDMPFYIRYVVRLLQPLGRTKEDCAEFILSQSVFDEVDQKGGFKITDQYGKPAEKTQLHTEEAREFMWTHTQSVFQRILKTK